MQANARQPHRAPDGAPVHYERHLPEQTTLYRLVQQHAETFFAEVEAATGASLPQFVKDEFDAFLECGILAKGFLRLRCGNCGHDKLVAFSCKRRGFCPSCGARRMAQTAAHLVDHVIPHVPVRQWVLSLPIPLRLLLAAQPQLVTPVLQVVHRVITRHLLGQAGLKADEADSGAVTLIQRFGSAANLNIHLHCLVLDGAYRRTDGEPVFVEVPAPSDEALQALLQKIIARLMKLLTRRGVLIEEEGSSYLADSDTESDDARTLRPLQAAAATYRIAFGPRAGQKVFTVQGAMPRDTAFTQALCADMQGFSLHAAVRCGADERQRLEQLCRYITRPALANERVQCNSAGQVVLKLKTAWRDGSTHIVMSPLEFMQRLAALVPRPRLHLIRSMGHRRVGVERLARADQVVDAMVVAADSGVVALWARGRTRHHLTGESHVGSRHDPARATNGRAGHRRLSSGQARRPPLRSRPGHRRRAAARGGGRRAAEPAPHLFPRQGAVRG